MRDLAEISGKFEKLLRLENTPVAIKFIPLEGAIPDGLRKPSKKLSFCAFITAASAMKYPLLADEENIGCPHARMLFGFGDVEEAENLAIATSVKVYGKDFDTVKKIIDAKPKIRPGEVKGIAVAPLSNAPFDPDALILLCRPLQATYAVTGYIYETGEAPLTSESNTNSMVCSYSAIRGGYQKQMNFAFTCAGAHTWANHNPDDVYLSIPWEKVEAMLKGIEERAKNGIAYPGGMALPAPLPMPPAHIFQGGM